tara:strand:+ start:328 stop:843 length:516 start_codon:yes stop_codon:yes gene_type:complete
MLDYHTMDYSDATDFHKVITDTVHETFAIMEHDLRGAGYNEEERKERAYNDYVRVVLESAVGDTMDVMSKELYDYMIHRFGGYLAVIKKYFEVADSVAIFQMPEYKTANLLMRHTLTEYIHENNMVEYTEYKEWKGINGYESESDESDNEGEGEEEGESDNEGKEGITTID